MSALRLFWLALGAMNVIAAVGGSHSSALPAMFCGFMAGREGSGK